MTNNPAKRPGFLMVVASHKPAAPADGLLLLVGVEKWRSKDTPSNIALTDLVFRVGGSATEQ
ncbi:hypothetical protein [Bradyrhizobium sp. UFLA05-112]